MAQVRDWVATHSKAMQEVIATLKQRALDPDPLFLTGESGVGKRRLARWVHQQSAASRQLVICQLGGEPEDIALSVLPGKIQQAKGGVLFLDEIGDLPRAAQEMILDLLPGADLRLIASSSDDLEKACAQGLFTPKLLDALGPPVPIPPLRERKEDIPSLISDFLTEAGLPEDTITPAARELLLLYSWPENVRELKHTIIKALHLNGGLKIKPCHLPPRIRELQGQSAPS